MLISWADFMANRLVSHPREIQQQGEPPPPLCARLIDVCSTEGTLLVRKFVL